MTAVLDASAVLALLFREKGAGEVEEVLADSAISAVNWSEITQKLAGRLDAEAWTADRAWASTDLGVRVRVIR